MSRPLETDPLHPGAGGCLTLRVTSLAWTILEGPQSGVVVKVEGDHTTIGTAPECELPLKDTTVSRRHALVTRTAEGLLVRDLDSKNGTFVDGARVREAYLIPGARLRCGATVLTVAPAQDDVPVPADERLGEMVGTGPAMKRLFGLLKRVAATEMTVVLTGETGTGKDVAARALHAASARAAAPFVVLDCAALDRELVSAELFGHEAGAFTGATGARAGAFEQAQGGTLFIDEIGELPADLQPKLLRALERREVKRLGAARSVAVDCRVIAATHRDLAALVKQGAFRQDLYYRLAQVVIRLPSLRDRREDIPALVAAFVKARRAPTGARGFTPAALSRIAAADLPGNIRELRNLVESSLALATGALVEADDLQLASPAAPAPVLDAVERDAIAQALERHGYHRGRAAAELGISDTTLRAKIRRYGLWVPPRG